MIFTVLKDKKGAGYIWFLFATMAILLIFGMVFSIMNTTISINAIRCEVDDAAKYVFADIRTSTNKSLALGDTENTATVYDVANIEIMFAEALKGTISHSPITNAGVITVVRDKGIKNFTIEEMHVSYFDRLDPRGENFLVCDINEDNHVDSSDVTHLESFLSGAIVISNGDADGNGVVDEYDVHLVREVAEYVKTNISIDTGSKGLLVVSFSLSIPLSYGTREYKTDRQVYTYSMPMNIKPAV